MARVRRRRGAMIGPLSFWDSFLGSFLLHEGGNQIQREDGSGDLLLEA